MRPLKILVVDDEQPICEVLQEKLTRDGHVVVTCNDGMQALAEARERQFDVVFLDIKMPGMNGAQTLRQLHAILPKAKFAMITGYASSELVDESLAEGAFICMSKPFGLSQISDVVSGLAEEQELEMKLRSRAQNP